MTINNSTSLMTNQKNAVIMPADKQFKVLQTQEGNALFFSINDANQFFCTREIQGDVNGWGQIDLMKGIEGTPKNFDIAQDLTNNSISIIAVVTDSEGKDHLYVSVGNKNTDADWTATPPTLTEIAFDDPDTSHNYDGLPISDIYLAEASTGQYIVADIVTGAFISRYFVDPSYSISEFGNAWIPHDLSGDLNPGTIINALGYRPGEDIPGIYTFGAIGNKTELIYTPLWNETQAGSAISSTVFTLPPGISEAAKPVMAVSAANAPYTDLFLAYGGSLYFLANADQQNLGKAPACIYTHDLLQNISSLHVNNWNGNVVVWGLSTDDNNETQVFIMECPAGSEAIGASDGVNATEWSCPIPLIFGAVNVASFVNNRLSSSVIFAHMADGTLLQLVEDPVTTAWRERSILIPPPLPPAVLDQPYESITYTTHLEFLDDYKSKVPNTPVAITASSPCSVYIDNVYYNLDTTVPVNVTTDQTGTLNIIQPVDNLGCVCYNISAGGESITINPMTDMMGPDSTIAKVSKGDDLNVTVTDETGAQSSLLGDNVQEGDRDAAAATIMQLTKAAATMPADGSLKNPPVSAAGTGNLSAVKNPLNRPKGKVYHDQSTHTIFGVDFTGGRVKYLEGIDQMTHFGITLDQDNSLLFHAAAKPGELGLGSIKSWIESKAGKILRWAKKVVNSVENWVINLSTDVADFFVTIAGQVYHFVLNCYHDVVNSLHSLLNTLETTFEKIKQWIGFLFSFQDILRTHNVMKSMINVYVNHVSTTFASLKGDITEGFNQLKQQIDQKTGLPVEGLPDVTYSSDDAIKGGTPPKDSDSPGANYAHHHVKSNGDSSGITYTSADNGPDDSIFKTLRDLIDAEGDAFKTAGSQIQDIAKNIKSQPITKTITQFMGVVVDLLVNTAENILLAAVDVLTQLIEAAQDVMNATIPIPVLNYFYKKITKSDEFPNGQDLTPLDVCCLLGAIPSTVIYKAVKGVAPFPEGAQTDAIIHATDINSLQAALVPFTTAPVSTVQQGLLGHGADDGETLMDIISSISATFGALVLDLSVIKRASIPWVPDGSPIDPDPANVRKGQVWTGIAAAGYMLYVLPDAIQAIQGIGNTLSNPWYVNLNNACTGLGVGKALVDATSIRWGGDTYGMFVSPALDFVINALWQVPTTKVFLIQRSKDPVEDDVNNVVSLAGGTAFDASGILSIVYAACYYQPSSTLRNAALAATVAVISLCNLAWGGCCLATTFDHLPVPTLPQNS